MATYKTNKTNVKVYNIRGTHIATIQSKDSLLNVTGAIISVSGRGSCYPINNPFVGYVKISDVTVTQDAPSPEPEPNPVPSGEWKRYFVLHDWNSPLTEPPYGVRSVAPNPQVNRIGEFNNHKNHQRVLLTAERQFFWADLVALKLHGKLYQACSASQKQYIGNRIGRLMGPALAFTNSTSAGRNYVNGEYSSRQPLAMAPLICGGNTILGKPAGKNSSGQEMVMVFSFLTGPNSEPLQSIQPDLMDPRVLWGTIIHSKFNVDPFPQLSGLSVPYPLFTPEYYYFPSAGLQEYSLEDELRSQYYPPREYYP